jgi:alpha-amylase/alpha-mannosidase (GH57 family)
MAPLFIHILWHMHQPWYWDEERRIFVLPWVRTHATKDYLFMGKLIERFPAVRVTFNFAPSLLEEIRLYLEGREDRVLQLAKKKAACLTDEEKREIFEFFFLVSSPRVFERWPRYGELWEKRTTGPSGFRVQDFLDLQILYQIIWFDPLLLKEEEGLRRLWEKGRDYVEEDKETVWEVTRKVFQSIVPQYRKLRERGQIEIAFSPFYHPILPLIADTRIAQETGERISLPSVRYTFPQDAREQIRRGKLYARDVWGGDLLGMWPSEGSLSKEVVQMACEEGVQWMATGEEVLFRTIGQNRNERGEAPQVLYSPHCFVSKGRKVFLLFRDRVLSDAIGFVYHAMDAQEAVKDFMSRLEHVRSSLPPSQSYLVNVVLDGENAWEYYKDNGFPFLEGLYEALSESKDFVTTTPSQYLREVQGVPILECLSPGSWIFGSFATWIGHPEKNWAWEKLFEVRKMFEEKKDRLSPSLREKAYEALLQAEGSDWFWWLGEDHPSPQRGIFVNHFVNLLERVRKHIEDGGD